MIVKIDSNSYLKRVDNMSFQEKVEYHERVGEWLDKHAPLLAARMQDDMARFQSVTQLSAYWNDAECNAWTIGAELLTALTAKGETWLPDMLYEKAAKRTIRRMKDMLKEAYNSYGEKPDMEQETHNEAKPEQAPQQQQEPAPAKEAATKPLQQSTVKPTPVRPKHIDQYIHLLPKKTQEKASMVRGLLRDLDVARENARKMMDAGSSADKTAQWAKTATKLDDKIHAIYSELDMEWDKLVEKGIVSIDAFGNAVIMAPAAEEAPIENTPEQQATEEAPVDEQPKEEAPATEEAPTEEQPSEEQTAEEAPAEEAPAEETPAEEQTKKGGRPALTEEQKAKKKADREAVKAKENLRKATLIRKWLIDMRNAKSDEQQKKWIAKYKEMVKLGGEGTVTEKVLEAAQYYEIDLKKVKK